MEEEKSSNPEPKIDTDGGTFIQGDVDTDGGDFVGRDKIIQIGSIRIPRALARWIGVSLGLIALATVIGTGLRVFQFARPTPTPTDLPTPTPTLPPTPTPTPQPMTGDFRILVAQFGMEDENHTVSESKLGREISNWLARRLNEQLTTPDTRQSLGDVTVWHDDLNRPPNNPPIGVIYSEEEATQLVNDLDATLVIYGVLSSTVDTPELQLSFYYGVQQVREEPDAAIGRHQFGKPVPIAFSDPTLAREKLDSDGELTTRVAALVWLSKALTKEIVREPTAALDIYRQGESLLANWENPAAKSVFYFFMGRTALGLKDLGEAERTLQLAVDNNEQNVAAHIGLGNYYFTLAQLYAVRNQPLDPELQACGDPRVDVNRIAVGAEQLPANFDELSVVLQQAQQQYSDAIALAEQPSSIAASLLPVAQVMLASSQRMQGEYAIAQYQMRQLAGNDAPQLLVQATEDLDSAAEHYPQSAGAFQRAQRFGFLVYTYNGMGLNSRAQGALAQLQQNSDLARQSYQESLDKFQQCDALKDQKDPDGNADLQRQTACYCRYYEQKVEQDYLQLGGGQG